MQAQDSLPLGPLTVANRLWMAPVKTGYGTPDGMVTDRTLGFFQRRAQGGAGAISSEPLTVDIRGREHPKQLGAHSDEHIDSLTALATTIKAEGAVAIAHLNHAGRAANPKASGFTPEAPSAIPCPASGQTPEVLDTARIAEIVNAFGAAAGRVKQAGFDAIELQFGLGYLISQFWSARTNQRSDEYGGNTHDRRRFASEVLATVRKTVGTEYPLFARLSASEQVEGGFALPDALEMALWLEEQGVSALHVVSGSACDTPPWYYQHMALPEGRNETWAAEIKQRVQIPVIVAGRLGRAETIDKVLSGGMADAVAMGRALVADPDLPHKVLSGAADSVHHCGHCLQGCLLKVKTGAGIGCIINPEVGEEYAETQSVSTRRKVVVVGGGPAGMQAALHASERGHEVRLLEARDHLGGQFDLAFRVPGKQAMQLPYDALIKAVTDSNALIQLNTEATAESIVAEAPDEIILATGSTATIVPMPGLAHPITGSDVLYGNVDPGQRVLIVGGGLVGVETVEFLLKQGKEPTIVEMLDEIARDMEPVSRKLALNLLSQHKVPVLIGTRLVRMDDGIAELASAAGTTQLGPFDSVVLAVGATARDELSARLRELGYTPTVIGDAAQPRQIYDASKDGWKAALELV